VSAAADARDALRGLTTRGRCLLAAGLALGACAIVLGQRDLLRAAVLVLALPLCAVAVVARTRYRLACSRSVTPSQAVVGQPATVTLRLDNVSRLPSGVLLMEDAVPYVLGGRPRFVLDRVEPRGVREVSYSLEAPLRGRYRIGPLQVRLADPFALCELQRGFASTSELTVTPLVWPLPPVRLGGDWTGGGDAVSRMAAVAGSDDTATREYRSGDDLRKVHWRSTARVGELMVRREEQPFQSRATLLLDGRERAHRGGGTDSSYEWAVSAVASIGAALARSGFALRLLDETGEDLAPPGAPLTESLLLDTLAEVAPGPAATLEAVTTRLRRSGVEGVLVAVLGQLDADSAERLARLRHGAGACVAVLLDTVTWQPGRPGGAAPGQDDPAALLTATGWRVLRVSVDTALADVWPQAARSSSGSLRPTEVPA
jgi:uncharacterized protein (DUF58 family)